MHPRFLEDLRYWVRADPRQATRLLRLVDDVLRDPFDGIGKPEALRGGSGFWSRRIDAEHRLTYRVAGAEVEFLQARYHYER